MLHVYLKSMQSKFYTRLPLRSSKSRLVWLALKWSVVTYVHSRSDLQFSVNTVHKNSSFFSIGNEYSLVWIDLYQLLNPHPTAFVAWRNFWCCYWKVCGNEKLVMEQVKLLLSTHAIGCGFQTLYNRSTHLQNIHTIIFKVKHAAGSSSTD